MSLVHRYKNNGYNIILDINSGCIHVVDELVYEAVGLLDEGKTAKQAAEILDKTYPVQDVANAMEEIQELTDKDMLFTTDIYEMQSNNFQNIMNRL